ncbi:MAG: OsmC family protein [Elusimicrobiota bacterium]|nr:OsmC family protein [Elusimicrobiota bacterium]
MLPLPHRYGVRLRRSEGAEGVLSSGPRPKLVGAPPPEFGGPGDLWSPEHLLLAAASLCLMTTFIALADKSKLGVLAYDCKAEGLLDKAPEGLGFTSVVLRVTLEVAEPDRDKAERLMALTEKHCLVSNSLKRPVSVELELKLRAGRAG